VKTNPAHRHLEREGPSKKIHETLKTRARRRFGNPLSLSPKVRLAITAGQDLRHAPHRTEHCTARAGGRDGFREKVKANNDDDGGVFFGDQIQEITV